MNPKDKAKEVVDKFIPFAHAGNLGTEIDKDIEFKNAKCCAIECVKLIIIELSKNDVYHDYWDNVKTEILKL